MDQGVIGVVSDTHGLLRPELARVFAGVGMILHAGDVGDAAVLDGLRAIAPVVAVRGNVDSDGTLRELPKSELVDVCGRLVYVVHSPFEIDVDPYKAGIAAIVYGHTHRTELSDRAGVLYLNPGSAGPRRPACGVSAALLRVRGTTLEAELVDL